MKKVGLVLTGGGARAAYQAGVLHGISEFISPTCFPFPIISGISAGSINAAFLACYQGSFQESTQRLWDIWNSLESEKVFRQTKIGFASLAVRALLDIIFGHFFQPKWPDSILDNNPLERMLNQFIDGNAIDRRLKSGDLQGVSFSAANFSSGITATFFEAHEVIEPWISRHHYGIKTCLNTEHVMASCAIPLIFRLVEIDQSFYGDGSTRVTFPIAPAIRLGAEKILAIDMRFPESVVHKQSKQIKRYPELGDILATLLDSLFSDSLDQDLERLRLVNELVKAKSGTKEARRRVIPSYLMRPSKDLASLVTDIFDSLSVPLRRILDVLNAVPERSAHLVSHLAFERVYTERCLELGRRDAHSHKKELQAFIEGD